MKYCYLVLGILSFSFSSAQVDVKLHLDHHWNGEPFAFETLYEDANGDKVEVTRLQYYLCDFFLKHDGGQDTKIAGGYLLAAANETTYNIGSHNITNLESIRFALGVDSVANHADPGIYLPDNPLSYQVPSMHWGWVGGYKFIAYDGYVDSDDDDDPDDLFEIHVTGSDSYFTPVGELTTPGILVDGDLHIKLRVNVADWLQSIDLVNAGAIHGVAPPTEQMSKNTTIHNVFEVDPTVELQEVSNRKNSVIVNYAVSNAPTFFYQFPREQRVDIIVRDIAGKQIVHQMSNPAEGRYYIKQELPTGIYLASFISENGLIHAEKFVVR